MRYFPVAQLVLEQVAHAVLDVPEQPPLLYLPAPQVAQVLHEKPLLVPEHDPVRYFPAAQLVLEQVAHAVLDVPEQPLLLYLPAPQVAQVAHALLAVGEQARVWNLPVLQVAQVEHAVSDMPEQSKLLYLPVPQVAQVEHVPADVGEWRERYFPTGHVHDSSQPACRSGSAASQLSLQESPRFNNLSCAGEDNEKGARRRTPHCMAASVSTIVYVC